MNVVHQPVNTSVTTAGLVFVMINLQEKPILTETTLQVLELLHVKVIKIILFCFCFVICDI